MHTFNDLLAKSILTSCAACLGTDTSSDNVSLFACDEPLNFNRSVLAYFVSQFHVVLMHIGNILTVSYVWLTSHNNLEGSMQHMQKSFPNLLGGSTKSSLQGRSLHIPGCQVELPVERHVVLIVSPCAY